MSNAPDTGGRSLVEIYNDPAFLLRMLLEMYLHIGVAWEVSLLVGEHRRHYTRTEIIK